MAISICMISSCSNESDPPIRSGGNEIKAEAFCNLDEFVNPLRETFILIDAKTMLKTKSAKEFAKKNEWLRDILLDLADPKKSLASGFMSPRERVSIIVLPRDGSTGSRAFTGCLPGFTPDEREEIAADSSALAEFFTGTSDSELQEAQGTFRTRLIGGLQSAASQAGENRSRQTGKFASTPLMEAFRASQGLLDTINESKRFVFISDLSGIDIGDPDIGDQETIDKSSFERAIADARQSAARFGQSEIYIVQPPDGKLPDKDYLRGFFLAQGGDLISAAVAQTGIATAAPTRYHRFRGQAEYPSGVQPLEILLGADKEGKLVQSWMIFLLGEEPQPVPLMGQMRCSGDATCKVISEQLKFSQSWSPLPGGEAEFSDEMPFGGMRNFELSFESGKLTGRVTDPAVGDVGNGRNYIVVKGKVIEMGDE